MTPLIIVTTTNPDIKKPERNRKNHNATQLAVIVKYVVGKT